VPSNRSCKNAEGAGFPLQIESLEDRVDNPVHGLHVDEADHEPGAAADSNETALDDIGGAQLAPQMAGESARRRAGRADRSGCLAMILPADYRSAVGRSQT
jgi:hypothetical protein